VTAGFEKRLLIAWLILAAITIASLSVGSLDGQDALRANAVITVSVIAIALIKVRIIFRELMEVRHAPVLLRRLTDIWLLIAAVTLLGTYFVGTALQSDESSSPVSLNNQKPLVTGIIGNIGGPLAANVAKGNEA
jgi:drug/metabolite transporter (DMT)-like permease